LGAAETLGRALHTGPGFKIYTKGGEAGGLPMDDLVVDLRGSFLDGACLPMAFRGSIRKRIL